MRIDVGIERVLAVESAIEQAIPEHTKRQDVIEALLALIVRRDLGWVG